MRIPHTSGQPHNPLSRKARRTMNPLRSSPSNPDPDADAGADESRRDLRQRDIVDDAIALMRVVGTLSALEYLKCHAVDKRVITRVLLEPGRRRGAQGLAAV